MTFGESISTCFQKYAEFSGRARLSEYWWWVLFIWLLSVVVNTVAWRVTPLYAIGGLLWLGLLIPSLAVAVRRLHDTGRSGWFLLIVLIPLVGGIILIVFLATAGEPGPNQYGLPPKGPQMAYPGTTATVAGAPPQNAPSGWLPDPSRRHEYRYWDGHQWTNQIADGGVSGVDPL